ncbi:hypothetical protein U1Q18_038309 [Sarracenia purpurea var. burkii]
MEEVEEALLFGDGERRIVGARRLCELTSKQRHKLAERGVVGPLILMLRAQECEAIEVALLALLRLASGSERNKIHIAKSGVLPLLLQLLHCKNKSIFNLAIAALLILSSCTENKLPIAASGAIQLLVQILNAEPAGDDDNADETAISNQAKLDIIATLHNLSTSHQTIPSVVSSGVVVSLFHLIHGREKSSELSEKAMAMLERIVSSSEIALNEAARARGAIQGLVEALEEGSSVCKEHAVGVLFLICHSCRERYRGQILREGVMPALLQLSVDGTWRGKEMARALLLLLRDGRGSRSRQWKNVILEQAMEQIDEDEWAGTGLRLVEETIAKLTA